MYELTCPDCRHVMKTPFVRMGAVATCPKCKRQFQVTPDGVRRVPSSPSATAETLGPAPEVVSRPAPVAASQPAPASPREASPEPVRDTPRPSAPEPVRAATDEVAEQLAHTRRRPARPPVNRQRGPIIALLAVTALLVIAVGVGLFVLLRNGGVAPASGAGPNPSALGPTLPELDPSLVIAPAERIEPGLWEQSSEPDPPPPDKGPIRLDKEKLSINPGTGEGTFRAEVVASTFDTIETATVTIYLLDKEDRVFALTRAPLCLLSGHRRGELVLSIPPALAETAQNVTWRVETGKRLSTAVPFESPVVEPAKVQGSRTAFKIAAYNPLSSSAKRSVFVVTASDADGKVIDRWMVNWMQPVGPKQRVELGAITQLKPDTRVTSWDIAGVALP